MGQHDSQISALYKALEARRGLTRGILAFLVVTLTTIIAAFTIAHCQKAAAIAEMNERLNLMKINNSLLEDNFGFLRRFINQTIEKLENRPLEKLRSRVQALENMKTEPGSSKNAGHLASR